MRYASGAWTLVRGTDGYPSCLDSSPRPPELLHGFGDASLLRPGLAVVGSRRATPYGIACAKEFAGWAAAHGVVIVSGAAHGCDRAAHEAAIEAGGGTVAVLGCGADRDYPSSASRLLRTLRERHAVVSELDWGAPPTRYTFPNRNRIIAALSAAVLVVEASPKSGTFSTVEHAIDTGRDVLAVPGSVFSESSRGCNTLIRQGATPISDVTDLAHALEGALLWLGTLPESSGPAGQSLEPGSLEATVAAALFADPMRLDDAAHALGIGAVETSRVFSRLETSGVIARYPDGRYGASAR